MAKVWKITKHDGDQVAAEYEMPGDMSEAEVAITLQRLVSCHLSEDEVISASLPVGAPRYSKLLERIGSGLHYGENPFYTARKEGN